MREVRLQPSIVVRSLYHTSCHALAVVGLRPAGRTRASVPTWFVVVQTSSQRSKELSHPLQSAVEFRHGRGVGDANVLLRAKAFSGNRGYVHLAQQRPGDLGG